MAHPENTHPNGDDDVPPATVFYTDRITPQEYVYQAKYYTDACVQALISHIASNPELSTRYLGPPLRYRILDKALALIKSVYTLPLIAFCLFLVLVHIHSFYIPGVLPQHSELVGFVYSEGTRVNTDPNDSYWLQPAIGAASFTAGAATVGYLYSLYLAIFLLLVTYRVQSSLTTYRVIGVLWAIFFVKELLTTELQLFALPEWLTSVFHYTLDPLVLFLPRHVLPHIPLLGDMPTFLKFVSKFEFVLNHEWLRHSPWSWRLFLLSSLWVYWLLLTAAVIGVFFVGMTIYSFVSLLLSWWKVKVVIVSDSSRHEEGDDDSDVHAADDDTKKDQ